MQRAAKGQRKVERLGGSRGAEPTELGQQKGPPLAKGPLCLWRVALVSEKHSQDEVEGQSLE